MTIAFDAMHVVYMDGEYVADTWVVHNVRALYTDIHLLNRLGGREPRVLMLVECSHGVP